MGYYVRVFSTSAKCIPLPSLQQALRNDNYKAELTLDAGTEGEWEQLLLRHSDGSEIAAIERNPVEEDSLGKEELAEFAEEIQDGEPETAAVWLLDFFKRVQCIYAFQVLGGTDQKDGWEILGAIKTAIWNAAPSIIQADGEGFSNEDGYHVLWQFSDSVSGPWSMGVLRNGRWVHFQMELGNRRQREAFLTGEIPDGVTMA